MRYVKVLLLAILFFLALVFFFQNQTPLSQELTLTLNLFFMAPMQSISLPFYFLIISAFALGILITLCLLVWDKVNGSARQIKNKWRINTLEREVEKLQKQLGQENQRSNFLRKNQARLQAAHKDDKSGVDPTQEESKDKQDTSEPVPTATPDKP